MVTGRLKRIEPKTPRSFNISMGLQRTVKRSPKQSGKIKSVPRDLARSALPPGKRLSRTGNFYWETRRNRSDLKGRL